MLWTWRDVAWLVLVPWTPAVLVVHRFGLDPLGVLDRCGVLDVLGITTMPATTSSTTKTTYTPAARQSAAPVVPAHEHAALTWLSTLGKESQRTQRKALSTIARELQPGATVESFPWSAITWTVAQALRRRLSERYAPNTARRMLSAFRQVALQANRLGQLDNAQLARILDATRAG